MQYKPSKRLRNATKLSIIAKLHPLIMSLVTGSLWSSHLKSPKGYVYHQGLHHQPEGWGDVTLLLKVHNVFVYMYMRVGSLDPLIRVTPWGHRYVWLIYLKIIIDKKYWNKKWWHHSKAQWEKPYIDMWENPHIGMLHMGIFSLCFYSYSM